MKATINKRSLVVIPKISKTLTTVNPIFKFLTGITILFLFFIVGFYFGIQKGFNIGMKNQDETVITSSSANKTEDSTFSENIGKCSLDGHGNAERLLSVYTVKKGDTLLSIAKEHLNSDIKELIMLNDDKYPHLDLSLQNTFLEVGWELYLPPVGIESLNGHLRELGGVITQIKPNSWAVRSSSVSAPVITFTSQTKFLNKERHEYKLGDCVIILSDDDHVISVSPLFVYFD